MLCYLKDLIIIDVVLLEAFDYIIDRVLLEGFNYIIDVVLL